MTRILVRGVPAPQGSKRHVGRGNWNSSTTDTAPSSGSENAR